MRLDLLLLILTRMVLFSFTPWGFDPKTLTAQRVIIHGSEDVMGVMGSKPIHLMNIF